MLRFYPCLSLLAKKICDIRKKPVLFYSGTGLAIVYLLYMLYILFGIVSLTGGAAAQWQMEWCRPGYIDFPISLIVGVLLLKVPFDINIDFLHILPDPMDSLCSFWLPAQFHVMAGTLFYFLLPTLIEKGARYLAQANHNRIAHGVMLMIPVLCSLSDYFEFPKAVLVRPFNTELWIQSGWVGLWLLLLIYITFTQRHHRRRVLFHFVLLPFVLWFPARAVMFEVIANRELYNLYDNMFVSFLLCYP